LEPRSTPLRVWHELTNRVHLQSLFEAVEDARDDGAVVHFANVGPVANAVLSRADFWTKMSMSESASSQSVSAAIAAAEGDALEASTMPSETQPLLRSPRRKNTSGGATTFGDAEAKATTGVIQ
jgi:hypothetical protein